MADGGDNRFRCADIAEGGHVHNPLRSEAEMFRVVVIVGIAAAPVIAVGLITEPVYAAILLALEIGIGIGLLWQVSRGSEPHTADVAAAGDDAHRVLVVANQTVGGRALLEELRGRCAGRRCEVFVVVPALPGSRLEHLAHDVDGAIADARERLRRSLEAMSGAGLRARGQVGDHHDPNEAIEDALREFAADEVVISTHPPERSKWLERGVVDRAEREIPLPVTHVIVDLEAEETASSSA
jgi:GABA permease